MAYLSDAAAVQHRASTRASTLESHRMIPTVLPSTRRVRVLHTHNSTAGAAGAAWLLAGRLFHHASSTWYSRHQSRRLRLFDLPEDGSL
jgi:hypothetical protein